MIGGPARSIPVRRVRAEPFRMNDRIPPNPRWLVDLAPEPTPEAFAAWRLGARGAGTASFDLPMPALHSLSESWRSHGRLRGGQLGAARFAGDEQLMLGELVLSERDFGGIGTTTHEAFRRRNVFKGVLRPDSALVAKGAHAAFSGHTCAGKDDDSPEGHDASPLRHTYRLRGSQLYRP